MLFTKHETKTIKITKTNFNVTALFLRSNYYRRFIFNQVWKFNLYLLTKTISSANDFSGIGTIK